MTDLMILNIVTLLMCLPVITAGAALTGMHYVLLKMVREQEGYIVPSFFRSFKRNLLQATLLWGVFLVLWYLISINLILLVRGGSGGSLWLLCALSVTALILVVVMIYTFAIAVQRGPAHLRGAPQVAGDAAHHAGPSGGRPSRHDPSSASGPVRPVRPRICLCQSLRTGFCQNREAAD